MQQLTTAFAVPMVVAQMPDCAALNAELRELFLAKAAEGERYANPEPYTHRNEALFESNFRLFDWPQPCVQRLRDYCWSMLYRTIQELNGYDLDYLRRLNLANEAWFHIA
jgi:hypothetical protein